MINGGDSGLAGLEGTGIVHRSFALKEPVGKDIEPHVTNVQSSSFSLGFTREMDNLKVEL